MERFCRLRDDDDEREQLLAAIAGRSAFRVFKSTIRRRGMSRSGTPSATGR